MHLFPSDTFSHSAYSFGLAEGGDGEWNNEYFLFDHAGQTLSSWDTAAAGGGEGSLGVYVIYPQFTLDLEGAHIAGARLGFDASETGIPQYDEFQLTSATLTLQLTGSGTMRIGRAPEPATASLAILAAASVMLACRRRTLPRSE